MSFTNLCLFQTGWANNSSEDSHWTYPSPSYCGRPISIAGGSGLRTLTCVCSFYRMVWYVTCSPPRNSSSVVGPLAAVCVYIHVDEFLCLLGSYTSRLPVPLWMSTSSVEFGDTKCRHRYRLELFWRHILTGVADSCRLCQLVRSTNTVSPTGHPFRYFHPPVTHRSHPTAITHGPTTRRSDPLTLRTDPPIRHIRRPVAAARARHALFWDLETFHRSLDRQLLQETGTVLPVFFGYLYSSIVYYLTSCRRIYFTLWITDRLLPYHCHLNTYNMCN